MPGIARETTISRSLPIDKLSVTRGEIQIMLYRWPDIQQNMSDEIRILGGTALSFNDSDTDLSDSESCEELSEQKNDITDADETEDDKQDKQQNNKSDDGKSGLDRYSGAQEEIGSVYDA
ncbi:hypothetical protein ACMFMG_008546 [Clarireedia jacksonii]